MSSTIECVRVATGSEPVTVHSFATGSKISAESVLTSPARPPDTNTRPSARRTAAPASLGECIADNRVHEPTVVPAPVTVTDASDMPCPTAKVVATSRIELAAILVLDNPFMTHLRGVAGNVSAGTSQSTQTAYCRGRGGGRSLSGRRSRVSTGRGMVMQMSWLRGREPTSPD
ncbi:hypothetical protein NOCA2190008 [metagenome]|uniref:Uncharacterized protein n=1 Tax=metagenome TaxID=256318 RepID=A0A2P2BXT4_9ZZZZ